MTERREHTAWDDGAATAIPITGTANNTSVVANGPLVFLGYSAKNSAGSPTSLAWNDGNGGLVYQDQVGGTTWANRVVPDRGVKVNTSLSVTVGSNGPITLVVFVRLKYREEDKDD